MSKILLLATAFGLAACSCTGQKKAAQDALPNTLSAKEKAAGWQLLFDGATTNGWHVYGKENTAGAWQVQDGALHFNEEAKKSGASGGDLVSNDAYDNFELQVEWKAASGTNSGIIFLAQDDKSKYPATYLTGPEMQVLDNIAADDNKNTKHLAGALYDLVDAKNTSHPKPVGEWNQASIKVQNGNLELKLNGVVTAKVTIGSPEWNQLIANSKFAKWPDFAKSRSGHIALQDHGHNVWFRNIKIRKL
ncbi:hypothetical protein A8C56_08615 [Niabella ginsenosidivorans]|uniref:3-keto-alpha-glucoside-1,2-lyase/3-keto-2-hydroxy-glucal hydratase domain-containing protein n=1 Tax=Niabella ginsenosidivorans TaxID=1176587 RepID=A0A1A9I0K1_9BACT|nr:DUF1080 domain-containing protein [Niabella ginsenosidivorans]ANH81033.1 hypothetical protein A8C56_08615 [Niabella ginsenosidivorans]